MKLHQKLWPTKSLWNVGWRYLLRNPLQTGLMVLGIVLGVAVVTAIDLANVSASRAFDLSTEAISGRTTHQIVGGPQGIEESIYVDLRRSGITRDIAPVIASYVWSPELGSQYLQLLGIDPFAEGPFRDYVGRLNSEDSEQADLGLFLTMPNAVLISDSLSAQFDVEVGDQIPIDVGGKLKQVVITGLIATSRSENSPLNNLMVADIAAAQELTEKVGTLSHIDLVVESDNSEKLAQIRELLPEGARIQSVGTSSENIREMTRAFQVNLTALSLLALLVGMFLIYNTMTFSVVRRRPLFGILRSIGVLKGEVFGLIIKESVLLGLIGSTLGMLVGVLLSKGAILIVSETINDLYFVSNVRGSAIPPFNLAKGMILGLVATLTASIFPALEAAKSQPRNAINRSVLEFKAHRMRDLSAIIGIPVLLLGIGGLSFPTDSLFISFISTLITVIGFAMFTPLLLSIIMRAAKVILKSIFGFLGRLAPQTLIQSASRTSVAIAALMIAISVSIGMSLMVGSFRHTVDLWLGQTLQGDIYVFSPGVTANEPSTEIDARALELIRSRPEFTRISELRSVVIDSPAGAIRVGAINDNPYEEPDLYMQSVGSPEETWQAMEAGGVTVAEPLAQRLDIDSLDDALVLYSDTGPQSFPVVGIYRDYSSSQGTMLMARNIYDQYWDDPNVTDIGLWLREGEDPAAMLDELNAQLGPVQRLIIRQNERLKERALEIFDQAFAITYALQLLAIIVAFVGIVSALLAMQLDRAREIGILRAIGLSVRQVWGLVMLETGLMGAMAGLLAMPVGYGLSLILIFIINKRAFGWTLQMELEWLPFLTAFIVALGAALMAGLYPALRTSQMATADVMRGE